MNDIPIQERHKKQLASMRSWLDGKGFHSALRALEIVRESEEGTRKDMATPKLHHQLSVTRLLSTLLPHFIAPEATLIASLFHDQLENHGDKWTQDRIGVLFGGQVSEAVWILSKKTKGIVKDTAFYYGSVAEHPIASLVKLADRAHNLQTMAGVFTPEKQAAYVAEVDTYYYPMIRTARRAFPQQYGAYENLKILLRCQCRLIQQYLDERGRLP